MGSFWIKGFGPSFIQAIGPIKECEKAFREVNAWEQLKENV